MVADKWQPVGVGAQGGPNIDIRDENRPGLICWPTSLFVLVHLLPNRAENSESTQEKIILRASQSFKVRKENY